jgi:hypothetical protein
MFERTKIDNTTPLQSVVPVEVATADGEHIKGRVILSSSKSFVEVLNGPSMFIEFEPYGGERVLIAKASLKSIRIVPVPSASGLAARMRDADGFEPYAVLGLAKGAPWEDVRQAYLRMAKTYHPDCYANAALPDEVRDYLAAMVRRINAAYAALEEPHQNERVRSAGRSEPVYTSRPRA